jgi:NifB/MoaA-like Fe-S oxidoreductase
MTLAEAKIDLLVGICDDESLTIRAAIVTLPDRARLDQLDPLVRALIETRLHQLVQMRVVS